MQAIYPDRDLHFPKGELTHCSVQPQACGAFLGFTAHPGDEPLGALTRVLGDRCVKIKRVMTDLGGEQIGRDKFKPDY